MDIRLDDLTHPAIHALLEEHLASMRAQSPRDSVHALDLDRLRHPSISFWTAWDGDVLIGCGALRELDAGHGEFKSMRTPAALRRRGAGKALLQHIVAEGRRRGYAHLSLETGVQESFAPAHALYMGAGFVDCGPFGDYKADVNSRFLTLALD
jgi:putative acetyltransferase